MDYSSKTTFSQFGTASHTALFTSGTAFVKSVRVGIVDVTLHNIAGTAQNVSIFKQLGTAAPTNRISFKLPASSTININRQIPHEFLFTSSTLVNSYIYASSSLTGVSAPNLSIACYVEYQ